MCRIRHLLLASGLLLLGPACASSSATVYIHPLADFSLVQKIAVLPLQNLAADPNAGEWVRQILVNEILAQGAFEVVEPWQVNKVLVERQVADVGSLSPEELTAIAQDLGAQAVLLGTVLQFERGRFGTLTAPEIGVTLRLVDAETGIVIWSASDSISGVSFGDRLLGTDGPDLTEATSLLVRNLLATLLEA